MPSCSPRPILIFTKAVTQILLWITLASLLFYSALLACSHYLHHSLEIYWAQAISQVSVNVIFSLFPVSGFLGDVYFGRYKAVMIGLALFSLSQIPTVIGAILWYTRVVNAITVILLTISFVLIVVGLSFFNSNILQFGLDQLMEKPSDSLGVLVHWAVWAIKIGILIPNLFFHFTYCGNSNYSLRIALHSLPICFIVLFTVSFLVSYCTRHHFNRDRVKYNPYKMIFKVLNFARKNKYPVGPVSAFAHCYDYRPSRLDYAKERYGGPFTTSDVEDVKSFKRVILVLLAFVPIFILQLATNSYFFRAFKRHTEIQHLFEELNKTCTDYTNPDLYGISVIVALPIYMWLIYCVFRNRRPKILHRLVAVAILHISTVVSMLVIDLTGHIVLSTQHNQTQPVCMFVQEAYSHQISNIPWWVFLVLRFVISLSNNLLLATSIEFISAQSPQAMKGVLVGSFFALFGVSQVFGTIFTVPFFLPSIWKDGYLGQHPPVVSCGFGYYLVCITVAMIGFISFVVAVKRYKYRRRDEEPYSQACVEEIFARRIAMNPQYYNTDRSEYEELAGSVNSE